MKKLLMVVGVVGVVTCAGLVWAGSQGDRPGKGPGGRGPEGNPGRGIGHVLQDEEVAKSLGVTDEQRAKLRDASYEMRKQMIKLEAEQELARLEVDHLMSQDSPDRAAVNKAVEESGRVETELQKVRIEQRLTTEAVLGEETLAKIRTYLRDQMQERQRERPDRGRRGRGDQQMRKGGCAPQTSPAADDDDDEEDDDKAPPPEGQ